MPASVAKPADPAASGLPEALRAAAGSILLVGAGRMGSAMLQGWLRLGLEPARLAVLEPQPSSALLSAAARGLRVNPAPGAIGEVAAAVIAVKPQVAPDVVRELAGRLTARTLVLSIMAGRTLTFLDQMLPEHALVRAMPNMPGAFGRGITVAVPNARVSGSQRTLVHALLSALGAVEWIADETLMDAVTALSGSGPAYVFLLAEAMTRAGAAAGLPADLAANLARATVAGSGEVLQQSPLDPAALRKNVTSPGGTTAAALEVLMGEGGIESLMIRAVASATARSRELAD